MENQSISLKDLQTNSNTNTSEIQEVSTDEILPESKKPDALEQKMEEILGGVDTALERKKIEIDQRREEIIEEVYEKQLDEEEKEEIAHLEKEDKISVYGDDNEEDTLFIQDEDLEEIDSDESDQLDTVKSAIKEKIKPITNVIDIKSFSISKSPVSVLNSLKATSNNKTVDWALIATGVPIEMESFSGLEIQRLDPRSSAKNRFNTYKEIYSILYNHVIDGNKPATVEQWVKLINFFDIDHLYFTAYKASFDGSNFIPYSCDHCKNIFMEDTPIDNMIKYKNDKIKEHVLQLLQQDSSSPNEYNVELVQISDDYVIGFREPSIYNVIFENVILDEKFTEKYNELLSLISYIDSIYYINRQNQSLQPIDLKQYPNNAVKTVKNKVIRYSQIIQSLTSDQLYAFNSCIKAINDRHDDVIYVLPAVQCPKCGKMIPEQEMTAESLLFTRHQLTGIANT